jgi:hypothetical protein
MVGSWSRLGLILLLTSGNVAAAVAAVASQDTRYPRAVQQAVALLPKRPLKVVVIDVNDAKPAGRVNLFKLQAFILRGSAVIYLTKHGEVLLEAVNGSRFHVYVLATVIWHEMAHVDGAGEAEARRQEEELWTRFITEQSVDRDAAMRYLAALKKRSLSGDQQAPWWARQ